VPAQRARQSARTRPRRNAAYDALLVPVPRDGCEGIRHGQSALSGRVLWAERGGACEVWWPNGQKGAHCPGRYARSAFSLVLAQSSPQRSLKDHNWLTSLLGYFVLRHIRLPLVRFDPRADGASRPGQSVSTSRSQAPSRRVTSYGTECACTAPAGFGGPFNSECPIRARKQLARSSSIGHPHVRTPFALRELYFNGLWWGT
jgi:hypothetical protein